MLSDDQEVHYIQHQKEEWRREDYLLTKYQGLNIYRKDFRCYFLPFTKISALFTLLKGEEYMYNSYPHLNRKVVVNIDLKGFFSKYSFLVGFERYL